MKNAELIFFWIAVASYLVAFISLLFKALFGKNFNFPLLFVIAGFVSHTLTGLIRWIITGHAPVLTGFENNLAGSWFILLISLVLAKRFRVAEYFLLFVLPFSMLMLGNGIMKGIEHQELTPSFRSPWLAVHVIFAWLSYGSFSVAAGIAVYYLLIYFRVLKGEEEKKRQLEEMNLRIVGFGFIAHTVMVSAGAIWAYGLWGSYWSWDPVETWSLITWLAYGINIHLQVTLGWRGARAQVVTLLCLIAVIVTYFGLGLIHEFHIRLL